MYNCTKMPMTRILQNGLSARKRNAANLALTSRRQRHLAQDRGIPQSNDAWPSNRNGRDWLDDRQSRAIATGWKRSMRLGQRNILVVSGATYTDRVTNSKCKTHDSEAYSSTHQQLFFTSDTPLGSSYTLRSVAVVTDFRHDPFGNR